MGALILLPPTNKIKLEQNNRMEEFLMNILKSYKSLFLFVIMSVCHGLFGMGENLFHEVWSRPFLPVVRPAATNCWKYIALGTAVLVGVYLYKKQTKSSSIVVDEQKGKSNIERSLTEQRIEEVKRNGYQISATEWIYEVPNPVNDGYINATRLEIRDGNNVIISKQYESDDKELQEFRDASRAYACEHPSLPQEENAKYPSRDKTKSSIVYSIGALLSHYWNVIKSKL